MSCALLRRLLMHALQADPDFHKASIRMATCYMRMGDSDAARAGLVADAALLTHADVAAKLEEVEAHAALLTAVGPCAMLPMHAAALEYACMEACCGDNVIRPQTATHVCVGCT